MRSYKQLFEHFRKIRAAKKLRREFENCGLEHKFDFLHDLLCEHDLEEETGWAKAGLNSILTYKLNFVDCDTVDGRNPAPPWMVKTL